MKNFPSSVLSGVLALSSLAAATCYNPDGTAITHPAFQPCNQVVGQISQCCGTNWTGGVVSPDTCQPNGLCLNSYEGAPLYWRGSCTDPTWKSPNCLRNLCTDKAGDASRNVAVTDCGDGTWCCEGQQTACCAAGNGTRIAATIGQAIVSSTSQTSSTLRTSSTSSTSSPSSSPTSQTSSSTTSATHTSSASPEAATSPSTSDATAPPTSRSEPAGALGTGAKIGIGAGVSGVLLALGVILTALFCMRRRKTKDGGKEAEMAESSGVGESAGFGNSVGGRYEMPSSALQGEKPALAVWHEVAGRERGRERAEMDGVGRGGGPVELPAVRWSRGI